MLMKYLSYFLNFMHEIFIILTIMKDMKLIVIANDYDLWMHVFKENE